MLPDLPHLFDINDIPSDFDEEVVDKYRLYIDTVYKLYCEKVAFGGLTFKELPVNCQHRPETFGKHFGFWHMMQEGPIEDERTIDLDRCKRVLWISWAIKAAANDEGRLRVFPQSKRHGERPWAIWLHDEDYVIILFERKSYYLLKTAFMVKTRKRSELQRDWEAFCSRND